MRTDIYGLAPRQHDMFASPEPTLDAPMTPDDIRRELERVLAQLRAADAVPWPPRQALETVNMFPALAAELPADEAARLNAAFDGEMARLRSAE